VPVKARRDKAMSEQATATEELAYIGREQCGCIVFATTADTVRKDKRTRDDIARMMRDGLSIERASAESLRNDPLFFPSKCPHKPQALTDRIAENMTELHGGDKSLSPETDC
jgi:hypothetical protein